MINNLKLNEQSDFIYLIQLRDGAQTQGTFFIDEKQNSSRIG